MTLEQALERIEQLERALCTMNALAPPIPYAWNPGDLGMRAVVSTTGDDRRLWEETRVVFLSEHEIELANTIFPRQCLSDPAPAEAYRQAKGRALISNAYYIHFTLTDDRHIGIDGLPVGCDLRGLISEEVAEEYDFSRDAMRVFIRGFIPRQAIEDRKR